MKLLMLILIPITCRSRPARGAWIEILIQAYNHDCKEVAPRTGRVD